MNNLKEIAQILEKSPRIYMIGDGGSAAMADHFACDLLKNCRLPAISLCSNAALITAIANDYSFEEVFLKQLQILYNVGDLLIIFTTSGNSPNLIKAAEYAEFTIAVAGNGGGKLKDLVAVFYDLKTKDQLICEDRMSEFCHKIARCLMLRGGK